MVDKSTDTAPVTDTDIYAKDDADFREIVTQRYMYNVEECGKAPLVGHLLNLLPMPPILRGKELKPWSAFLIRTTRPTKAKNRDKVVVDVPAGSEVLIPATFELMQFMSKAATSEDKVFEVKIVPNVAIDIGGGQSLWTYVLGAKPVPVKRQQFGLSGVLGRELALPAAGHGAQDGDIPF